MLEFWRHFVPVPLSRLDVLNRSIIRLIAESAVSARETRKQLIALQLRVGELERMCAATKNKGDSNE